MGHWDTSRILKAPTGYLKDTLGIPQGQIFILKEPTGSLKEPTGYQRDTKGIPTGSLKDTLAIYHWIHTKYRKYLVFYP